MSLIKAITNNTNLTIGAIRTFLTDNVAADAASLTVENVTSFESDQILVVGDFGNEGAEIVYISSVPGDHTISLTTDTIYSHSSNDPVIVIDFDQVKFYHADTVDGAKTLMATVGMVVDTPDFTRYQDNTYTTGFYFIQFYNSVTSLSSNYSDPIPVTGYGLLSARTIIDKALGEINKQTSETLSDSFAFQQMDNCQSEVIRELKRWSFMQKFDSIIGQVSTGSWKVAIPSDLDDENTNKSIYQLRVGTQQRMTWVDKEKFDEFLISVGYTTLADDLIVGATTMVLESSADFDTPDSSSSGSATVTIGGTSYNYTDNDVATGTLTLSAAVASGEDQDEGADVFQGATQGLPNYWTIYGGYIFYNPNTSDTYDGNNIYMDYYIKQTAITSDYENIILPDPTVVIYYLCWKFLKKLNNGQENESSLSYMNQYIDRRSKMKQKEVMNRTFIFRPRVQNFNIQSQFNEDTPRWIRDARFPNTGF